MPRYASRSFLTCGRGINGKRRYRPGRIFRIAISIKSKSESDMNLTSDADLVWTAPNDLPKNNKPTTSNAIVLNR